MKERPILFSAPMVRALLDGSKTQTRRLVKPQPPAECGIHYMLGNESWLDEKDRKPLRHHWEAWGGPLYESRPEGHLCGSHSVKCPYGQPGDRLWVRETWAEHSDFPGCRRAIYRADPECEYDTERWRPSIHMPRWASRILLEIVSVRVERLNDCSESDAAAEGWQRRPEVSDDPEVHADAARDWYRDLWETINGSGSWATNPWVWVIDFKRVTP